jgi:hypothetical protein
VNPRPLVSKRLPQRDYAAVTMYQSYPLHGVSVKRAGTFAQRGSAFGLRGRRSRCEPCGGTKKRKESIEAAKVYRGVLDKTVQYIDGLKAPQPMIDAMMGSCIIRNPLG